MHRFLSQPGFSLLEAVVSIGIVLLGLVAIISLSTVSLISGQAVSRQFEAVNFAREAMETVRNQRDSNWLAFEAAGSAAWNDGLFLTVGSTEDHTAIVTMNYPAYDRLEFSPDALGDTCLDSAGALYDCTTIWYQPLFGRYIQTTDVSFSPAGYEDSGYKRLVELYPICRDGAGVEQIQTSPSDCSGLGAGWEQVGIDAVVTVQWGERGGTREYTIEEHLYDWKY